MHFFINAIANSKASPASVLSQNYRYLVSQRYLPNLEKIIRGLVYVYAFSLPFKDLLFVERNGLIILLTLVGLWCFLRGRIFLVRIPIAIPLLVFVSWVALTVPAATFPLYSLGELGKFLRDVAIFFVVLNFFRDCSRQNLLLQVMLASILLFGTYGIVELFTMSIYKDKIDALVGGNMWLSAYLVLLIPVGISLTYWESKLEPRLFYGATTGIGLTCLVFSYSRAGLLAMACEALLLSWLMKKRAIGMTIVGTIVLFLGAILFFQVTYVTPRTELRGTIWEEMTATHNWEARVNIWSLAADKLWQHPVLGIGFGKETFNWVYKEETDLIRNEAKLIIAQGTHNTFIDLALTVGIPGLIFFLWLLYAIMRTAFTTFYSGANEFEKGVSGGVAVLVPGFAVRCLFDHMFVGNIAIMFWILVAICFAVQQTQIEQAQSAVFAEPDIA